MENMEFTGPFYEAFYIDLQVVKKNNAYAWKFLQYLTNDEYEIYPPNPVK